MSLKKVMLFYGVFGYTCSDSSSARSLYKQRTITCFKLFKNEHRINLIRCSQKPIWTEWTPNEPS